MVAANGGAPLTAPNLGTFNAQGGFTPATFGVGAYVPGIGTAPRPYRVSTGVDVPSLLGQVINSTNPYADGAFPSGHTNSGYTQALGVSFLVPQQMQEMLTRASDLGNNRILAGMHSPLDVIGAGSRRPRSPRPTSMARSTTEAATGSTGPTPPMPAPMPLTRRIRARSPISPARAGRRA